MKKVISIMLVLVMCFSLCACTGETKTNEIELTLDNYDDYLEISAAVWGSEEVITKNGYWLGKYSNGYKTLHTCFYSGYLGSIETKVVAPNFNFHNVTITIHFTGKVLTILEDSDPMSPSTMDHYLDFKDTFELNVGGTVKNGEGRIMDLPNDMLILEYSYNKYGNKYDIQSDWEIVEISGTVSPA